MPDEALIDIELDAPRPREADAALRFIHLRVHSAYSLSQGAIHVKDLIKLATGQDMPAVAVTDTNNLFGALEFAITARGAGLQPIIGCELSFYARRSESGQPGAWPDGKLVLLVQNEQGYRNLLKLVSQAYLGEASHALGTGLYYDAVPPEDCLGLIALTGGPEGSLNQLLAQGQGDQADAFLDWLQARFDGRLYVELQRHGWPQEQAVEGALLDLAYAQNLPLVATNNSHFKQPSQYEAHDALLCIDQGLTTAHEDRRRLTAQHDFKSEARMIELFADLPEAIANTAIIAQRCAYAPQRIKEILPPFDCGPGRNEADELTVQAHEGLAFRMEQVVYTPDMSDDERAQLLKDYTERLEYELDVIKKMGFPGYFLIVADFIKWAKDQGIPVGPGRGSGAGSLVAYCLLITDLNPIPLNLLFERFLNPERVSMPDFDIDFCQSRRDEVIRYVQDKYGHDKVAQIITFGKLQARAVLRDVGRVLQMPYGQVDRICKLVPNNPANPVTLEQALESEPDLRDQVDSDPAVAHLVGMARQLEGLYRHASTHAAGVVIGDRPLHELVPLYRDPRSPMPVTQFNMKWVESAGLVKFDFLGLKTLTVIQTCLDLIKESCGDDIDMARLPMDDPDTFAMLSRAEAAGVFQLESSGMRQVLRDLKPDRFEDIIAVVSLYRPGPMDNIPSYVRRKHGEEEPDYMHPLLEPVLKETFGIMIYQEQVMQAGQVLAGYSLGGADLLRRAMGKKIPAEMATQRQLFESGAAERDVPAAKANEIFDRIEKFAGYGFNKSHAAAYALVSYHTAWLKCHYPAEFLAASMTLDLGNTDKLGMFKAEADRLGIEVRPPDVNRSKATFSVEVDDGKRAIRYALGALKNVGEAAIQTMTEIRAKQDGGRFAGLADFFQSVDGRVLNKRLLENLVQAGAFDTLHANRHQILESLPYLLKLAAAEAEARNSDTFSLFGDEPAQAPELRLEQVMDWPVLEKLEREAKAVGFYLSAHPLEAYDAALSKLKIKTFKQIAQNRDASGRMAAIVTGRRFGTSARGNRFAFIQLSDASSAYEAIVFSETLSASRDLLEPGTAIVAEAAIRHEGDDVKIAFNSISALDEAVAKVANKVDLYLDRADVIEAIKEVLEREGAGRGELRVCLILDNGLEAKIDLPGRWNLSPKVRQALRSFPGAEVVEA